MQAKTVQFLWTQDGEGRAGYVMRGMPHFDPGHGLIMAHDLLEHFTARAGIAGEAEAFGAVVWIRLEGGYFDSLTNRNGGRYRTWQERAADLGHEFAPFLQDEGYSVCEPLESEIAAEPDDPEIRSVLRTIAAAVARTCRSDYEMPADERKSIRLIYQWLCIGYRDVQKFYDTNAQAVAELFYDVEHTLDSFIKTVGPEEGDVLEVSINEDYTWAYRVIDGMDENGEFFADGEPLGPE